MPRTSKKLFEKNIKDRAWKNLFETLKRAKSGSDVERVLGNLLPQDEKAMLEKRLLIISLLKEGVPIREISRRVDVTRRTITFLRSGFRQRSNEKGRRLPGGYPDRIWKNQKMRKPWPSPTRRMP